MPHPAAATSSLFPQLPLRSKHPRSRAVQTVADMQRQLAELQALIDSPTRNVPLESEIQAELADLPEDKRSLMSWVLFETFLNGSIRYRRKSDKWYVVDRVIHRTKPLRKWVYDFLLGIAGLGYAM